MVIGQGPSMKPTFGENNVLMVNRLKWRLGLFDKGDIVFSRTPFDDETNVVKRIAYLPGDMVKLKNGESFQLGHNHYWLLGDNPDQSFDSRHYGPIPGHMIQGLVVGSMYPALTWF